LPKRNNNDINNNWPKLLTKSYLYTYVCINSIIIIVIIIIITMRTHIQGFLAFYKKKKLTSKSNQLTNNLNYA